MITVYLAASFVIGTLMTFHASMNARVGSLTNNPTYANTVFWVTGAIVALVHYLVTYGLSAPPTASSVPRWLYLAGGIGVAISLGLVYLIPRVGIVNFTLCILAGQLICSNVLSSSGFLTDQARPFDPVKLAGLGLVFAGSWIVIAR